MQGLGQIRHQHMPATNSDMEETSLERITYPTTSKSALQISHNGQLRISRYASQVNCLGRVFQKLPRVSLSQIRDNPHSQQPLM